MSQIPDLLPVQKSGDGSWEVRYRNEPFRFESESDARKFARAEILFCMVKQGGCDSYEHAAELEELARVMRECVLERDPLKGVTIFEQSAEDMRERLACE